MDLTFFSNNVEFFVFVFFLTLLLIFKRKRLTIQGSFPFLYMLLYNTRLGLDKMSEWSKKMPNFFRYLSYLSIFVAISGIFISTGFMIYQLKFIVDNNITSGGGFVLPIKTESAMEGAVPIFYVPFWYWIIALFVLIIVHEFAHGVIAERWKVKIKSSGFAFLGIIIPLIPAAFVEPDTKSLNSKKWWQKIAVLGAGSMSNFIFAILFFFVWIGMCGPFIDSTMQIGDISFSNVTSQSGFNQYNISSGNIVAINSVSDKEFILLKLKNISIDEPLDITLDSGTYLINPYYDNQSNRTMIGVSGLKSGLVIKDEFEILGNFPIYFERLLFWLFFLNLGIGIMNLLPIWITDGGQVSLVLLEKIMKPKRAVLIYNIISFFTLITIIFTLKSSWLIKIISIIF